MEAGENMRTEQEIREEIESINKADKGIQKDYCEGKITQPIVSGKLNYNASRRVALKWVLDEKEMEE
jgi:hypothetical protein